MVPEHGDGLLAGDDASGMAMSSGLVGGGWVGLELPRRECEPQDKMEPSIDAVVAEVRGATGRPVAVG
jgi:hypothetical protein